MTCAAILDPTLILESRDCVVDVETSGELTRGWSLIDSFGKNRAGAERARRRRVRHRTLLRHARVGAVVNVYLPPTRPLRERVDTAQVLTRFHYVERELTLACGGWIARTPQLETKAALARMAWQCGLAADALRARVFELRYPSRLLEEAGERP